MTLVKVNNNGLRRPLTSLFDEFFQELPSFGKNLSLENWGSPAVNIHETPEAYHLELNVPNKEDFKVNVENSLLTVSFEKKEESKSEDVKTIRREFSYRSFSRSFNLDQQVDAAGIQAKYENGLLKIFLPKKAEAKEANKQINID
jgi:HSP20 family protein